MGPKRYKSNNLWIYWDCRQDSERIIDAIISRIPDADFPTNEIGDGRKIVQIDETMLNYKI